MRTSKKGFTLIELLIAMAIVGILAGIGYPSYRDYITRSHEKAAMGYLTDLRNAQELYRADRKQYTNVISDLVVSPPEDLADYYDVSITEASALAFTMQAVPVGTQSAAGSPTLTLDETGAGTPSDKW